MIQMMQIMMLPFLACLVLTGIHAYLGIHVIEREVIFVDLSLAQIASLGALVALLFGIEFHSLGSYLISLGSALIGAFLFSISRLKERMISQEVIIGVVYAVATALSIIVLNSAPSEAEHIKEMLIGNILFVSWNDIVRIAILYAIIGIVHIVFRKKFLLVSADPEAARAAGVKVVLWDFIFYATFAIVITASVAIGGVLLVFSLLIVPAVCGIMISKNILHRLFIGWTVGVIGSILGIIASAKLDLPTGAAIVVVFGVLVSAVALWFLISKRINVSKQMI